ALLILAVGLLIGAFVGWSRWLVVVAAALTLGLIPPTLTRAANDGTYTDTVTVDSQFVDRGFWSINRPTGTEVVDLSRVTYPRVPNQQLPVDVNGNPVEGAKPITTYDQNGWISVVVDAGKAIVTLPRTGKWQVYAHTSFGTISMPDGVASRGFNAQGYLTSDGTGGCCSQQAVPINGANLRIDISVSYGDIEVRRAAS
ncbi:MAG: hypothetical protein QOG52_2493, partial [Frankiaceae bacterium]|nr:hypothetical protein [Frankiaceae bacterium]